MANTNQGLPGQHMVDPNGNVVGPWYAFFLNLWQRLGGATGSLTIILDSIASVPGDILYRNATIWTGLPIGPAGQVLQAGAAFPQWGSLTGANFGSQAANLFLAAPSGGAGVTSFRQIASADLAPLAGQYPGNQTASGASIGNIGEYLFSNVPVGSAVTFSNASSGTAIDVTSLALTAGDWDVWGNFVANATGATTQSNISAWINTASVTDPTPPNGGCYAQLQTTIGAGLRQVLPLSPMVIEVAGGGQTVYLTANITHVGAMTGYGILAARRRS